MKTKSNVLSKLLLSRGNFFSLYQKGINVKKIIGKIAAVVFSIVAGILMVLPQISHAKDFANGSCVMGASKIQNNRLVFTKQIKVYANATTTEHKAVMTEFDVFFVESKANGRAFLVYAPGFDDNPKAGKPFGWVDLKDIIAQEHRNCL